jgi:AbrB family looped-hinge helix DNA binding protein
MLATVTSKGQITIPAAIREKLGIKARDKLDFVVDGNGFRAVPAKSLMDYQGCLKGKAKAKASFEEEREAAKQAIARRYAEGLE